MPFHKTSLRKGVWDVSYSQVCQDPCWARSRQIGWLGCLAGVSILTWWKSKSSSWFDQVHLNVVTFPISNPWTPVQFPCRGAGPGCNTREISDRLVVLKHELEALDEKERILDEHKSWIQQSLKIVSEDFDNEKLAFVTYEDLCQCFRDDTLLAIQAPAGTELEVPIPEKVK